MSAVSSPPHRTGYRETWSVPAFRTVFLTRALGSTADTLRNVALSVLVFTATGSPLLAAATYGISFLPQLLGGGLLGAVADRLHPRRLIAVGFAAECAAAALLAGPRLPVWASLAVVAGISCLTPVFIGSSGRVLAQVLTGEAYVLGRSLTSMASSVSQLLGLAGGGAVVAAAGPRNALWVTAVCHLAAACWSWAGLRRLECGPLRVPEKSSVLRSSWSGNAAMLKDRVTRTLLLAQWLPCMLIAAAESLIIPYAATAGFADGSAGPLLACLPLGMAAGSFLAGRVLGQSTRERAVVPLMALLGLPLLPFAWSPSWYVSAVLLLVSGLGFAYGLGIQQRFREAVPEESRGQGFTLMSTGLMTLQGVGPLLGGSAAEVLPVGTVVALTGGATLLSALLFQFRLPLVLTARPQCVSD